VIAKPKLHAAGLASSLKRKSCASKANLQVFLRKAAETGRSGDGFAMMTKGEDHADQQHRP
jgi:hypothetical protein